MAGIGFELKRLFAGKGLLMQLRATMYAGSVIAGPMILGTSLLFLTKFVAQMVGLPGAGQDAVVVMITWSILFPLILTSCFTYLLARFISDMLYENDLSRILPSMYATIALCLLIGSLLWGVFLYYNDINLNYKVLSFILFCEAVVVWIQISYTNATKDYRAVMLGFVYGISVAIVIDLSLFINRGLDPILILLLSACAAYAAMIATYTRVLHAYFPIGKGTSIMFLLWASNFPSLLQVGLYSTLGLFAHIMMMWTSPWGLAAIGKFYHAPQHDIPVLFAFFTTLVTTVNFVTSVEVKFYGHYKTYFSLLNDNGSLADIEKAYNDLITVLKQELFYLAQLQLFVTVIAIVVIGEVLEKLGFGFNSNMIGLFRVLCVGYGLFAVGNAFLLFLLYITNYRGALVTAATFAVINILGTLFTINLPSIFYGFGFVLAGLAMYLVGWLELSLFLKRLDYHIYCKQPIFVDKRKSLFEKFIRSADQRSMRQGANEP